MYEITIIISMHPNRDAGFVHSKNLHPERMRFLFLFRGSSVVERMAVNHDVTGSNPVLGAKQSEQVRESLFSCK